MHSRPPVTSAASAITPARCGSSRSKLISCWHDKHPLTCDNDTADSWKDGWTRQPPTYQESICFSSTTRRSPVRADRIVTRCTSRRTGLLPSRNTGQIPSFGPTYYFDSAPPRLSLLWRGVIVL